MSENKQAVLYTSDEAAAQKFTTNNIIPGGCESCACEVLIHYHYDSGKPVPDAPFVLTDSQNHKTEGKTDANGRCFIYNMGCGNYELLIDEGSDEFTPKETVENNPVLQANPDYAVLAGEYFTLFILLRKLGLLEYDADHSNDNYVDIDNSGFLGGIFNSVPDEYRKAWNRFHELDSKINRGSIELKRAINKIHHSLAAEIADKTDDDNSAVLLFCEIALGFIPVVGQAMDVYSIGEWSWNSYENPALLDDNLHVADGALCVIGLIPGLGDALKVAGRAIIKALRKTGITDAGAIQHAMKVIRSLSDGNLVQWLIKMRSKLQEYGAKGKKLLQDIHAALFKVLNDSAKNNDWIVSLMKDSFKAMVIAIGKLIEKYDRVLDEIGKMVNEFIGKVVTRVPGSSKPKGSNNLKNANGESAATESHNAGTAKDNEPADSTAKKKQAEEQDKQCTAGKDSCQTEGEPVDMATGAVVDWRTDFTLSGLLPLPFKRYYRSAGERIPGLLGRLWRSNWDIQLSLDNGIVTLTDGEFNQAVFALPLEGETERAASNPQWRLTRQQGQLRLINLDGTRYSFDHALGKQLCLTAMENRAGQRINFLWERSALRWLELPDGRLVHVETAHQRITSLTLCDAARQPIKTLASYRYDQQGYLLSVRAGEGRNFDYQWSPEGWLLRWNDLSQTWVEHTYDEQGRSIKDQAAGGYWDGRFVWDDEKLTGHYYSGFGGVTSYVRDARNNILCRREPDGGETHFEWIDNQLVAQTDALGNRTEFTRNDWGQITSVTLPNGAVHRYEYDDSGQLLAYTNPLGSSWSYQRNALGQLQASVDAEGRAWQYSWNTQGQLVSATAPDGIAQHYHYNARGLLQRLEPDNAPAVTFWYDSQDRLTERHIAREEGVLIRRWEYQSGREAPAKVIYEDGTETRFSYDIEGNLTAVTDALGQSHLFCYGAFDNLTEVTDPLGATVRYHYNAESEFAGVTNSHNQSWQYRFDHSGRLSEEQHYDGRVYRYQYDLAGQLAQRTAPDGSVLAYRYDAVGQLSEISASRSDGTHEGITCFSYDLAGRLLQAAGPDATVEYEWSPAGALLEEKLNGRAIRSGYDQAGRRAAVDGMLNTLGLAWHNGRLSALSIGSHQPLSFSHNAMGQEQLRSNGQGFALRHEWSATGLLSRQWLEPGGGEVNDVLERRYQYDALDRLTCIQDSHWGEQAFRLNGSGQITAERRSEGRRRQARLFGYDSEQNLCEVSELAPKGSQESHSSQVAHYDVAGRVIRRGAGEYRYDACGRLIAKRMNRAGFRPQETEYQWDAHDRLVRITLPDGARWRYRYDAFGRRVSKAREGRVESARALMRVDYHWDGDQLVGQQQWLADGNAARAVQWVYEPGSFRPLAQLEQQNGATQLHYIVTDLTGTARELCSEEGDVHWRGEQALWGEYREAKTPLALRRWLGDAANDEVSCDLRYPGQLYDAESGLYYNRHRYYDPELGQYISPDPIGMRGGLRPQGYVHNPVEWIDPFGLSDSTILDRAMGGQVGDRLSAHHVIPVEVWKENGAFLDKIGMGNQMNAGFNGIHVPGSQTAMTTDVGKGMNVFHSSNHNNYSNTVRDELSYIKEQYDMGELTDREARDAVRKLQIDMKNKIWRGDVSQTKCGRMN